MGIIMNSKGDNKSPWNITRCIETSPNVSTVFQLRIL